MSTVAASRLAAPHAQQHGLGKQLVRHALKRIIVAYRRILACVLVVHALTERLVAFYSGLGFEFWIDPFTGFLRVGDIRESIPDHGFLG